MKYDLYFKTIFLFLLFSSTVVPLLSQKKTDKFLVNHGGENGLLVAKKNARDREIRKYSDSLNKWNYGQSLPMFLFDTLFDDRFSYLWEGFHKPISIRKLLFEKVENVKILYVLANSSSPLLNYKVDSSNIRILTPYLPNTPYSNMSIKDLALDRIKKYKAKH